MKTKLQSFLDLLATIESRILKKREQSPPQIADLCRKANDQAKAIHLPAPFTIEASGNAGHGDGCVAYFINDPRGGDSLHAITSRAWPDAKDDDDDVGAMIHERIIKGDEKSIREYFADWRKFLEENMAPAMTKPTASEQLNDLARELEQIASAIEATTNPDAVRHYFSDLGRLAAVAAQAGLLGEWENAGALGDPYSLAPDTDQKWPMVWMQFVTMYAPPEMRLLAKADRMTVATNKSPTTPAEKQADVLRHAAAARRIAARVWAQLATMEPTGNGNAELRAVPKVTHSTDFTDVDWFGIRYTFDDGQQAKAIGCLWAEFEKGEHGLSEKTIGEKIGTESDNYRLLHTFRRTTKGRGKQRGKTTIHRAWGTMIQKVSRGVYRLAKPESQKKHT